ncbi:MAG: RIP metalloprotease RseP [Zoogloeaceae bacterium]|jgi:regulator of sigma E protease|nr:RIP metalloprotease RseP [Zoogloeaceae bacterium]
MNMIDALLFIVAFLLLISVLIVIHELGHFCVARLCGVKVLRFSLGFGRILWRRRLGHDQTEWTLCALPLGGYVKMLDEREADADTPIPAAELPRAFNRQSVGRRAAIVAAGPFANFLLAILVYVLMFWSGTEALLPILGAPPVDTPAAAAGIRNGDRVMRVGETPVATWEDLHWQVLRAASRAASVTLEIGDDAGNVRSVALGTSSLSEEGWRRDPFLILGLRTYRPPFPPVVDKVMPGMPAQAAGIQNGDRILAVDGQPMTYFYQVQDIVMTTPEGRSRQLTILRDKTELRVALTPVSVLEDGQRIQRVGLQWAEPDAALRESLPERWSTIRYGLGDAARKAIGQTWETSAFSLRMFGKILSGEVSWRNLSGPVAIAEYAGRTARIGLDAYLKFMALVSISLGILNLLPIPVLDGGHLLYYALEVIKGGPLPERVMIWGQNIGLTLLATLMAFALFNDLSRLIGPFFNS